MLQLVHASSAERSRALPGDELLPQSIGSVTHAITIRRPRREVWPWLVQMGAGRAGWYAYDFVDNGGVKSAERIVPELQQVDVGTVMPWLPGATDGFRVLRVEPERLLVLGSRPDPSAPPVVTWAFVLLEPEPGCTRLIARARAGAGYRPPYHLPRWSLRSLVALGHWIMQRRQLLGIARRAEHRH